VTGIAWALKPLSFLAGHHIRDDGLMMMSLSTEAIFFMSFSFSCAAKLL
jgi:hypothetical protein